MEQDRVRFMSADAIERAERQNPATFYTARRPTIQWLQRNGWTDQDIERGLGLKLLDRDRRFIPGRVAA